MWKYIFSEMYGLCVCVYIYIYILCECCSLFQCCVCVVGRLEVYCSEGKYGRLVNVEGWGVLVSWEGEGYILCFMMVSKIVLGNTVCLSFSWLLDKVSYIKSFYGVNVCAFFSGSIIPIEDSMQVIYYQKKSHTITP